MTTVASAVLFCSESKGSGFNANESPYEVLFWYERTIISRQFFINLVSFRRKLKHLFSLS